MAKIKKYALKNTELSMLNRIERDLVEIHAVILEIKKTTSALKMNFDLLTLSISITALIVALMH